MLKCWLLGDAKWDSLRKGRLLQCLLPGPASKETDHVLPIGTCTNTGVRYTSARIQAHTAGCTDQHSDSTTGLIPFPFPAAQGGLTPIPLMCAHTRILPRCRAVPYLVPIPFVLLDGCFGLVLAGAHCWHQKHSGPRTWGLTPVAGTLTSLYSHIMESSFLVLSGQQRTRGFVLSQNILPYILQEFFSLLSQIIPMEP